MRAGPRAPAGERAERGALLAMGLGLALMLLVPFPWAFRAGFFVVLAATVAHIVLSQIGGGRAGGA